MSGFLDDWLPPIPQNWRVKPLFALATERSRPNTGLPESRVLSLSYGKVVERDVESNYGLLPETFEGYNIVEPDDIVMRLTDLQNDQRSLRTGQVTERGIITSAYVTIVPSADLTPRFAHFLLHGYDLAKVFYRMGGGLRQSLKYADLKRLPLLVPPRSEQTRIANFLDEQTARIDALIAEKERLVGTLKNLRAEAIDHTVLGGEIKERGQPLNGLHVLGRAPRGWDVSRMKYELDYVTSGSRGWADYYADDGAIFIRIGNLTRDSITLDLADVQRVVLPNAAEGVRARVRPGDLLISITAYLGSVAVAPSEIEEAYVSQHVSLARPNFVRAIPDWLGYVVLSGVGKTFFDLQAYGGTKIQLSLDDIREMPVPLPSLDEQKRRIARLERRLAQLAHLEKHVAEHIALLREYRSSLISAAVTGQLDIDNFGRGAA